MSFANPSPRYKSSSTGARDTALLIFAKAPVPGRCKTRLARRYGAYRACTIYRSLLTHAVCAARQQFDGPITLVCAPDTRHAFFHHLSRRYRLRLARQARGDLGQRMHHAIRQGLQHHSRVVLMGSDQPVLDHAWLSEARKVLAVPNNAWLAPTLDGGYWAIGLRTAQARLFRGPRWSTSRVAGVTLNRMHELGLHARTHTPLRDIDDARDWHALDSPIRSKLAGRARATRRGPGQS